MAESKHTSVTATFQPIMATAVRTAYIVAAGWMEKEKGSAEEGGEGNGNSEVRVCFVELVEGGPSYAITSNSPKEQE